MKNLNKNQVKYSLIAIVVIIIIGFFFLSGEKNVSNSPANNQVSNNNSSSTNVVANTYNVTKISQSTKTNPVSQVQNINQKCNLKITNPVSGSRISFPLTIKGSIDLAGTKSYPCMWGNSQQAAGSVQVSYNVNGSGWQSPGIPVSLSSIGIGSTSTLNVSSSAISLNAYTLGIPSGTPIRFTFSDFNPLGNPTNTFVITAYLK